MFQNNDTIAQSLNLTPLNQTKVVVQNKNEPSTDNDYEYARTNLYDIIEKGQEALTGILDVANMSQHPRSYEVAANLIKTLSDVNKDLLQLAKSKKEIDKQSEKENPQTINNNLFVGSTSELQKMLKAKDNESS